MLSTGETRRFKVGDGVSIHIAAFKGTPWCQRMNNTNIKRTRGWIGYVVVARACECCRNISREHIKTPCDRQNPKHVNTAQYFACARNILSDITRPTRYRDDDTSAMTPDKERCSGALSGSAWWQRTNNTNTKHACGWIGYVVAAKSCEFCRNIWRGHFTTPLRPPKPQHVNTAQYFACARHMLPGIS